MHRIMDDYVFRFQEKSYIVVSRAGDTLRLLVHTDKPRPVLDRVLTQLRCLHAARIPPLIAPTHLRSILASRARNFVTSRALT